MVGDFLKCARGDVQSHSIKADFSSHACIYMSAHAHISIYIWKESLVNYASTWLRACRMSEKVNFYGLEWERERGVGCPIRMSIYVYGFRRALVAFLSSLMAFCFVPLRGLYFTGTNKAIVGHVYWCLVCFSLKITLSYSPGGISSSVDWNMKWYTLQTNLSSF